MKNIDEIIKTSMDFNSFKEYKDAKNGTGKEPISDEMKAYFDLVRKVESPIEPEPLTYREIAFGIMRRANLYINIKSKGEQREFIVDEFNKPVLRALTLYFTNDKEFETISDSFSLEKGIMLRGDVGRGKTLLLKLFSQINAFEKRSDINSFEELKRYGWNDRLKFDSYPITHFASCTQIARAYSSEGDKALTKFVRNGYAANGKRNEIKPFVFDDLGAEKESVNYGNRENVMEAILTDRYEMFVDEGVKTHITTNLMNGEDIEKIYTSRIRSRMKEMFNVIDLIGGDKRK